MQKENKFNSLINQKSPYLLQHSRNPVDWQPWGETAFQQAKDENKPVFLSIGYSTCHWCHVMERESFEDEEVAKLMNATFVNIKVDREELPDVDSFYMEVCQMLTGSGGWPLTIFLTPEKKPFFAGTYIPKESKWGRTGLIDLIPNVSELWLQKRADIDVSVNEIFKSLMSKEKNFANHVQLDKKIINSTFLDFLANYDENNGGFGGSPKFPTPHNLLFLLDYWKIKKDTRSFEMVISTLKKMREGGIYDHLGGGFHRYSTDEKWLIPHFEKMLYDQAMLIIVFSYSYIESANKLFLNTINDTIDYVTREMTDLKGGFYSAEDADSEGIEGKFYVWSKQEIEQILGKDSDIFEKYYGITAAGNFTDPHHPEFSRKNVLSENINVTDVVKEFELPPADIQKIILKAKSILFAEREKRVKPFKDDKVLTDWNGLMVAALAIAGRACNNNIYINLAENCAKFLLQQIVNINDDLLHRYRDGEAAINGFLDDYAFLIWGFLELYNSTFKINYLRKSIEFAEKMIEKFYDTDSGGFYQSSIEAINLPLRKKEIYDGAIPSGNSVAIMCLLKLYKLTGNIFFEEIANNSIKYFSGQVASHPTAYTHFINSLIFTIYPTTEIVLVGALDSPEINEYIKILNKYYLPTVTVIVKDEADKSDKINDIIPYINDYKSIDGKVTAYICSNFSCKAPINNLIEFENEIESLKNIIEQ